MSFADLIRERVQAGLQAETRTGPFLDVLRELAQGLTSDRVGAAITHGGVRGRFYLTLWPRTLPANAPLRLCVNSGSPSCMALRSASRGDHGALAEASGMGHGARGATGTGTRSGILEPPAPRKLTTPGGHVREGHADPGQSESSGHTGPCLEWRTTPAARGDAPRGRAALTAGRGARRAGR